MGYEILKAFLRKHGARRIKELSSGDIHSTCPFPHHTDRRPSFGVKVGRDCKGMYQCFGCGEVGSIWDLVRELEPYNSDVRGLVEDFAADSPVYRVEDSANVEFIKISEEDYSRFAVLHEYWEMRGINKESVKKFKLGYCPERWSVTFPVRAFDSYEIIGICFRLIDTHPSFPEEFQIKLRLGMLSKYSYFNGTKPSHSLFGVECIKSKQEVYLFEGPIDAINFMQRNPDKQALAKYGRLLTKAQVEYLSKFHKIYVVSDWDENGSGQQISKNAADNLRSKGIVTQILRVEGDVKDYTEAVTKGLPGNLVLA